jgi:hypothetical protein
MFTFIFKKINLHFLLLTLLGSSLLCSCSQEDDIEYDPPKSNIEEIEGLVINRADQQPIPGINVKVNYYSTWSGDFDSFPEVKRTSDQLGEFNYETVLPRRNDYIRAITLKYSYRKNYQKAI